MVFLCGTTALTGTDEFGVCRGLWSKLAGTGARVRVVRDDWDGLLRRQLPAMAVVAHSFLVDHWVVVLESGEDGVLVGDPLIAQPYRQAKDRFLRRWRGVLVEVVPGSRRPVPGS
jgi:ABC-type bacteriocin/lantibiotic exporter with double-glycine peptidase domain